MANARPQKIGKQKDVEKVKKEPRVEIFPNLENFKGNGAEPKKREVPKKIIRR